MWKMKRDFQIDFLKISGLQPDHHLLDIGCGTLRGGIPLIAYLDEGRYFGIEARAEVLDEGRKELRENGLEYKNPSLFAAPDISALAIEQKFDHAKTMQLRHQTPRTILVDDVEGTVHRAWSGCSNMSWIIDHTGRVHFKSNWTHEPDLRRALDSAVKLRDLKREGSVNQYFTEGVWYSRSPGRES